MATPNNSPTTYYGMQGYSPQPQQRATTDGTGYVPTVGNSKQKAEYPVKPQLGQTFPAAKPARPQQASHTLSGPGGHASTGALAGGQAANTDTIQPQPHRLFGADLDQVPPGLLLVRRRDNKTPLAHQAVGIDFARSARVVSWTHLKRMMDCGCRDCALFLGGRQAGREGVRQGLVEGMEKAAKEQATQQQQQPTRRVRPSEDPGYLAFDQAQRINNAPEYIRRHALAQGAGEQYLRRAGALPAAPPNPRDKLVERAQREAVIRRAGDEAVRGLTQQPSELVEQYIARRAALRGKAEAEVLHRLQQQK